MAENNTFVSLRRTISAQTGVSEKVADDFLHALFDSISEALAKGEEVNLKGFGTFRVQDVTPRESVNISTGERFTISGYKKIVFTADKSQPADPAEQPSAKKSVRKKAAPVAEAIDPIQKLGEQAEEIKGLLSELDAIQAPVEPEEMPVPVKTEEAQAPAEPEEAQAAAEPAEQHNEPAERPVQSEQQETKKQPFNPWLTTLITLVVFTLLLVAAFFFLRHKIIHWTDTMRENIEQRVAQPQEPAVPVATDYSEPQEETEIAETENPSESADNPIRATDWFDDAQRTFTEFKATETVGKDSRLAWVAKKHYGEKAYWVFVYEANRDVLRTPEHVLPGMQLRIPELPTELSNPSDPKTEALLERLSKKYLR